MAKLVVFLQSFPDVLHPISKAILSTALSLSKKKDLETIGILCLSKVEDSLLEKLKHSGLSKCLIYKDAAFDAFIPEHMASLFCNIATDAEIALFPATPEGRTLSSMVAAKLHTGVTADCTALSFTEDGFLLQTRPAFSGNLFASILNKKTKPQIASLRFASPIVSPILRETKVEILPPAFSLESPYVASWLEKNGQAENEKDVILALGNGLSKKEDIAFFEAVAKKISATLYVSRALVDNGFFPKSKQIGLSGQSVSPKFLLTFGISGSVQFMAGLQNVGTLCSVNLDKDAPILKAADIPIVSDMYAVAKAILEQ